MTHRYYFEPQQRSVPLAVGEHVTLTDAEAHHLLHVMRGKAGDALQLFDGCGRQYAAEIVATTRREVNVQVVALETPERELPVTLTLSVSLPKGDRARFLVEKLTELGVTTLVPLAASRAMPQPQGKALEKLRRYSVEACKQSGRNRLLKVTEPQGLDAHEQWLPAEGSAAKPLRLVAHPGSNARSAGELIALAVAKARPVMLVVGPEGGFTEQEVAQLYASGWEPVRLGSRILRIETAAIALAAMAMLLADV